MEQLPNEFTLNLPEGAFPLSTDSMVLSHFVRLPKNARVLDLGSGCGTLGLLLCAVNESCRVTGVELSQSAHLAAIDNIRRVIVLGTTAKRVPLHTIEYNLDQSYGLFMSGDPKLAVLRFDAEASPYLKRETWHPRQTLEEHGDEVVLTVPYTNPTELIGDIFRWREHVVVEAPEELRREVRECLLKTLSQY